MAYFQVEILWNDPYPKKFNYRTVGSSIGLGAYRALKQLRNENKGRRIKDLTIKIQQYATEAVI